MKKALSVLLVLTLCLSVGMAFATNAETGEVNGVKNGAITVYDSTQYKQIDKGTALHGATIGSEAKVAMTALLTSIGTDANIKAFSVVGFDSRAMDIIKASKPEVQTATILTFMGFFKADDQIDEVKAAIALLTEANIVATETPATPITFEGKDAELRTVTVEVEGRDGTKTNERFNFVRIITEIDWMLITMSESIQ